MVDDIVKEFLIESYENLDQLDRDLMALEDAPDDRNRLSSIFRTIHTIKGTSGFLAFPKLEHVTHVGENLLVRLRDGALRLNGEMTTGLLAMVDAVRNILGQINSTGSEGDEVYEELVARLERLKSGEAVPAKNNTAPQEKAEIAVVAAIAELSSEVTAAVQASMTKPKKSRSAGKSKEKIGAKDKQVSAVPVEIIADNQTPGGKAMLVVQSSDAAPAKPASESHPATTELRAAFENSCPASESSGGGSLLA